MVHIQLFENETEIFQLLLWQIILFFEQSGSQYSFNLIFKVSSEEKKWSNHRLKNKLVILYLIIFSSVQNF